MSNQHITASSTYRYTFNIPEKHTKLVNHIATPSSCVTNSIYIDIQSEQNLNATSNIDINSSSSIGHIIWPASLVFSFFLGLNMTLLRQFSHIIEIGTGLGMVGMVCHKLLSSCIPDHLFPISPKLTLTDTYPDVIARATKMAELNAISKISISDTNTSSSFPLFSIKSLTWGLTQLNTGNLSLKQTIKTPYDCLVIGSDVFFSLQTVLPIFLTILAHSSIALIAFQHRDCNIKQQVALRGLELGLGIEIIWSNNPNTTILKPSPISLHHQHHSLLSNTLIQVPEELNDWDQYVTLAKLSQVPVDASTPLPLNGSSAELEIWLIYRHDTSMIHLKSSE